MKTTLGTRKHQEIRKRYTAFTTNECEEVNFGFSHAGHTGVRLSISVNDGKKDVRIELNENDIKHLHEMVNNCVDKYQLNEKAI